MAFPVPLRPRIFPSLTRVPAHRAAAPSRGELGALRLVLGLMALGLVAVGLWPGGLAWLANWFSNDRDLQPESLWAVRLVARFLIPAGLALLAAVYWRRAIGRGLARALERLERPSPAAFLAGVLGLAIGLRLIWIAIVPSLPVSDFAQYYGLGARLAETGRYVAPDGRPTAFWPPGYPAYLAALFAIFGRTLWAPKIANVLVGSAIVLLTYLLGRRAAGETPGRLGAIFVAVFPSQVGYTSLLCSEIPFTFLALFFVWAMGSAADLKKVRFWIGAILLGQLLGAAAMIRPTIALFPAVTFLVLWKQAGGRRALGFHAVLGAAMLAVILPWGLRNGRVMGGFVPFSTNAGVNFYYGNNSKSNGTGFGFTGEAADETAGAASEIARNRLGFRLGMKFWREEPLRAALLGARKIAMMMMGDGTWADWAFRETARPTPGRFRRAAPIASNLVYWPIVLLCGLEWLIFRRRRESRRATDPYVDALLLYTIAITAAWMGQERYHFPIVPIFCIGAATLLSRVAVYVRARRPSDELDGSDSSDASDDLSADSNCRL